MRRHGNSLFQVAAVDEVPGAAQHMSIILEFVKTARPPSMLVRLQVHLLGPAPSRTPASAHSAPSASSATPSSQSTAQSGDGYIQSAAASSSSRGVPLSRKPLSSRPSTLMTQSNASNGQSAAVSGKVISSHIVLAFPQPFQTLPCTLSTIASRLNSAQKTALARKHQLSRSGTAASSARPTVQDAFLQDLLKGIEMCSDPTAGPSLAAPPTEQEGMDDSRFDRLRSRLREQRQRLLKGTFKDLHKSTKRTNRRKSRWTKGDAQRRGSVDSGESHLESQPTDHDYHITPFRV